MPNHLYSTRPRCGPASLCPTLHPAIAASEPDIALPATFPDVEMPRFLYGNRLRWIAKDEITDWGTVIGRFYSFASHRCHWRWCYLIWLDPDSPSSTWVKVDIAWEDDLEPLESEATP
jgi:hypothetical protein